ncbi:MAG: membrane protein insertase YidC [Beijerinckiaceae bacterium]|jgi:YidC/Oxa1 family membrane protein insertase
MKPENRNYYVAIALSILVVFAWNYFYAMPRLEKQRQEQAQIAAVTTLKEGAPGSIAPQSRYAPPQGGVGPQTVEATKDRNAALADSPRVKIDTQHLSGSIALKGARIDDIVLKDYRETPDPKSPEIILLSPANAPTPYYAENGYVSQPGVKLALPDANTLWTADRSTLTPATPVTLTVDNGQGLVFHRKISIDDNYMLEIGDTVENKGATPAVLFPYSLILRQGLPQTSGYSVLHEGYVGVVGDSGVQDMTYAGILKETNATKTLKGTGGWVGFTDKYWATALIPDQKQTFDGSFTARGTAEKIFQADTLGEALTIPANGSASTSSRLFAGAKVTALLDSYKQNLGIEKFDLLIDWGWFYFITKPMFFLLDTIYNFVGNFGLAIIAITFLVKAVFYPLANRSYVSMAKMKAAQPQLAALKERYPDDKAKQQQEMMAIYKKEKINPVAGCLPMVIQIPVFFSLYKVLFVTIEMRQAPFFGWIHDLSQPDPTNVFNLFGLIPFDPTALPMIGHFLAIGIWPLIMGFSMFIQMKMNPEPADPVQKQMFAWMPVIFTFMLGTFPSGLVIYWTVNNTLTVIQQSIIMKQAGQKLELWGNLKSHFRKKVTT